MEAESITRKRNAFLVTTPLAEPERQETRVES